MNYRVFYGKENQSIETSNYSAITKNTFMRAIL